MFNPLLGPEALNFSVPQLLSTVGGTQMAFFSADAKYDSIFINITDKSPRAGTHGIHHVLFDCLISNIPLVIALATLDELVQGDRLQFIFVVQVSLRQILLISSRTFQPDLQPLSQYRAHKHSYFICLLKHKTIPTPHSWLTFTLQVDG